MSPPFEVLHYTGGDDDRGGVISVVRNLAAAGAFHCVLGVNPGCRQQRVPALAVRELPRIAGEKISPLNFWRARGVARAVQSWLRAAPDRVYHGHSRAGLLVGLWLQSWGENRVVVSVHCYGRRRWFYRWAAGRLGARLYWLSPAMKKYYGVGDDSWTQCIPGCVTAAPATRREARRDGVITLGGIGALVRWKNWQLVPAALALLPEDTRRRFRFLHIGTDDGTPDSQAFVVELHATAKIPELRGLVEWRGQQASAGKFLDEIDCLVVASCNEPFSIAMLEALQAGVPVLAADSGGAQDIVVAGSSGWLFRSDDARELARQLASLAEGTALAGVQIAAESLRRFEAAAVAAQWAKVYGSLDSK